MHLSPKKQLVFLLALLTFPLLSSCGGTAKSDSITLRNRKNLAASYVRGGDFAGAVGEMKKAEIRNGGDPEVHLIKGIAYFGLQEFAAAERSYKRALGINNDYTKARYNLCGLYIKIGRLDDAIEQCLMVTRDVSYPLRYAAFVNVAKGYEMKGDPVSAERFFKQSIKLEPSNIYSRNEYGKLLVKLSREKEALRQFKSVLDLAPGYNEARLSLAAAQIKTGDLRSACTELNKILRNKPAPETAETTGLYAEKFCAES